MVSPERESLVLVLLADHLTNQEIAAQLAVGEPTVASDVHRILGKLRVPTRRDAARVLLARHSGQPRPPAPSLRSMLTPRQFEVLRLISEHLTNLEIAENLVLTEATVETHVHTILKKLGVGSRREAARLYLGHVKPKNIHARE